MNYHPLISVITVSYNSVSTIEETILSVINQTYNKIEYIIVDGGSSDGTVDIIKKYADKITFWMSEPDKGIYDAMNKGIKIATGEWINFMNCGDTFYNVTTIADVFNKANRDSDIIYGNTNLLLSIGEYIKKGKQVTDEDYMPFGHQASFSRNILMKINGFNTNFRICADRNFFYTMYKNKARFEYIDVNVTNYEAEMGISSVNLIKMMKEIGIIEGKDKKIKWKIAFYFFIMKYQTKELVKRLLPEPIVKMIRIHNLEQK